MVDINSRRQTVHNNEASTCPNYESISISAQSPVTVKSFYQTLCGYFATAKIFVYPDIEIVQEGDKIGFITYTDGEGRSKIKISLPVNALLEYFTKTENRTEFYAYFGYVADVSRNRRKSDFNQKPTLQFSNQTCQTDADNLNCEFLKMNDQWSPFTRKEDIHSLVEGYPKNEVPFHRGVSFEIKSQSIKNFVLYGHTSLLETVTYSTSDSLLERDTCIIFSSKNDLYSPPAMRKIIKENENDDDNSNILLFSSRNGQLRLEILSNVFIDTALQVAENLQNLNEGCNVRNLKDVIQLPESKNLQEIDLSKTNSYCENLDLEKTNTKVPSYRVVPTKMRKGKVKTQTKRPEWKIYMEPGEDELRNLVSDYFGDDMIQQAVYGMLGPDVDRRRQTVHNNEASTCPKYESRSISNQNFSINRRIRDSNQTPALQFSNKSWKAETGNSEHEFPRKYHEIRDKGIGKETKKRENEGTTDSSPVIFAKPGNSAVWKLMNERTKLPNTCKGKQTGRHILDQEINWDELIQGITVPDINRTEHNQENGCFGGHFDKIKTEVIKPEQEFEETVNTTKKEAKKLCKLCQQRDLDTIFLPCGHLVLCSFCCASQKIKICPQCFKEIDIVHEAHI